MGRLLNKNAIITGAARGMGAAHARLFIAEGATVTLSDLREDEGRALAAELGSSAQFVCHDVASAAGWAETAAAAERFGPVTILVNNAGISVEGPIAEFSDEDYDRVIATNQTSVFMGCRAVVPSMRRAGIGSIVNISSAAGLVGFPNGAAYCASKFAVRGLTKAFAMELASEGIRVNSVHPGVVETPMVGGLDVPALVVPTVPLGRIGQPADIAHLVLYLASDESGYCTGSEFIADGGLTAG